MAIPILNADGILLEGVHALRVLRLEILPKNSRLFAVMAEGPLAEIEKLRRQIAEQAQLLAAA